MFSQVKGYMPQFPFHLFLGCNLRLFVRNLSLMLPWRFVAVLVGVAVATPSAQSHADVAAGLDEIQWFDASKHVPELEVYCQAWRGDRCLHLVDLFSASKGLSSAFLKMQFKAQAFDIHSNRQEDILAEHGFYRAVDLVLKLFTSSQRE